MPCDLTFVSTCVGSINASSTWMTTCTTACASPLWRAKEDLLRSVPGVGPVLSLTLLAQVPELGKVSHRQLAA